MRKLETVSLLGGNFTRTTSDKMPSIHINEPVFSRFVKEYGYDGAKQKVKELCIEHAEDLEEDR